MCSIKSKDGTHYIQVPLPDYNDPRIVEKTYSGGVLKVTVEDAAASSKLKPQKSRV